MNSLSQDVEENRMIDRGEVLDHIQAQDVPETTGKHLEPVHCPMGTFAGTISVTIKDEVAFEPGLNNTTERMLHHSIPKWRCTDFSFLWFVDEEMPVRTRLIPVLSQLFLKFQKVIRHLMFKARDGMAAALSPCRFLIGM